LNVLESRIRSELLVNLAVQGLVVNHCLLAAVVVLLAGVGGCGRVLSNRRRACLAATWIVS